MINKHPPLKDLNIRIPIIIPIKGRGFVNHGSGLGFRAFIKLCISPLESSSPAEHVLNVAPFNPATWRVRGT